MRKALILFGFLNDSDVEWIVRNAARESVPQGTLLINEGAPISSILILLDGELAVSIGEKPVATLHAGEIVGEISFVDSRPPTASVQASVDSSVLAIPREAVSRHLVTDPLFAARFYQAVAVFLADRLRHTISRFGYGSAREDPDELDDGMMEDISQASCRFDRLLQMVLGPRRIEPTPLRNQRPVSSGHP
jgi:CRP/FNR family transcriptional regulator, cyclic AMP receptor protein